VTTVTECPTAVTSNPVSPPNRCGTSSPRPTALTSRSTGLLPRSPATSAATTTYEGPTSSMPRPAGSAVPAWIRSASRPSLTRVAITWAVITSRAARSGPRAAAAAARPTKASTSQPITVPVVRNADVIMAAAGWSLRLLRLVLAQASQRSRPAGLRPAIATATAARPRV